MADIFGFDVKTQGEHGKTNFATMAPRSGLAKFLEDYGLYGIFQI
jgi:hypothetical protein